MIGHEYGYVHRTRHTVTLMAQITTKKRQNSLGKGKGAGVKARGNQRKLSIPIFQ